MEPSRPRKRALLLVSNERNRAEEEARESALSHHETQVELAHANRVATMGYLAASIDQAERTWFGAVDLPIDYRGARRPLMGHSQHAPRCGPSVYCAVE